MCTVFRPEIAMSFCCTSLSLRVLRSGLVGIESANFGVHKCSSLTLSRRREPVDPTAAHRIVTPKHQPVDVFVVFSPHHIVINLHHGCDVSIIVSRGCCRATLRLAVGGAFPAVGTLVSPLLAISAVSLEMLGFGYQLLILALAFSLGFSLAVFARRESGHSAGLINVHRHWSSNFDAQEDPKVPSYLRNVSAYSRNQPRIALYDARTLKGACFRMFW